ncbi:MAG TPA: NUDIX domain-containing protein [Alphaproteobacteria bacterium]|nr:hypothetical protein [Rhodospirillaceae bacterium]HRJ13275.1 NUDIX domain-containing protein [Alphaproteobacteria bacterium]
MTDEILKRIASYPRGPHQQILDQAKTGQLGNGWAHGTLTFQNGDQSAQTISFIENPNAACSIIYDPWMDCFAFQLLPRPLKKGWGYKDNIELTGGGVKPGQTDMEAALAEAQEELGVHGVAVKRILPLMQTQLVVWGKELKTMYLVVADLSQADFGDFHGFDSDDQGASRRVIIPRKEVFKFLNELKDYQQKNPEEPWPIDLATFTAMQHIRASDSVSRMNINQRTESGDNPKHDPMAVVMRGARVLRIIPAPV